MGEMQQIQDIALRAASATIEQAALSRVLVEPAIDSEGHDALNVTVVLKTTDGFKGANGHVALDTMVRVNRDLQNAGEHRLPIFTFVTEAELASDADFEL